MAGIALSVDVSGLDREMQRMAERLRDMTPVFKAIGRALEQNINLRFDTKTDPSGAAWAEWSGATKAAREEEGRGTLLEYTGRMRDSLTFFADSTGVEVGFGVEYASRHEFGQGVPVRAMLFDNKKLSVTDEADVLRAAMTAIREALTP